MPVTGIVALGLGAVVLVLCAVLFSASTDDPAMEFEGKFAAGLSAAVYGAVPWIAQGVLTFVATIPGDGPWWLWLCWWGAPTLGFAIGSSRAKS